LASRSAVSFFRGIGLGPTSNFATRCPQKGWSAKNGTITDVILSSINRSRFLVADLTDAKPNCYYEVGYAHALRKPVIILAKEGTTRHFDISTYKWNYWIDYKDLKPKFEAELKAVLLSLGTVTSGV